jgi:hypothetical protein
MIAPEILRVNLESCTLGCSYCRDNMENGEVSIFVKMNLKFKQIGVTDRYNEQDIECCVVQLESVFQHTYNVYVQSFNR